MEYLYLCDGKACAKNCAENGYSECIHTANEKHALVKCRRQRKFKVMAGTMVEYAPDNIRRVLGGK